MKEKNRASLQRAIGQLPVYQPAPIVWEHLEAALDTDRQQQLLKDKIKQLPSYSPPAHIWEQVTAELEAEQPQQRTRRVIRLRRWSIAASLALLIFSAGWYFRGPAAETIVMQYGTEQVMPLPATDWDADEAAFEQVIQLAAYAIPDHESTITHLKSELDELEQAKIEIKRMMETYGNDPSVSKQLSEIERERTDVIKKMAALI